MVNWRCGIVSLLNKFNNSPAVAIFRPRPRFSSTSPPPLCSDQEVFLEEDDLHEHSLEVVLLLHQFAYSLRILSM